MRIKEGIYSFKLSSKAIGQESIINPTVIYDNDELILVDAGLPHQFHQIREAIEEEGLEFYKLRKIIFTHQDIDHIGSASEILKERDNNIKMISFQSEESGNSQHLRFPEENAAEQKLPVPSQLNQNFFFWTNLLPESTRLQLPTSKP